MKGQGYFFGEDEILLDPEFDEFSVPVLSFGPDHEPFLDLSENVEPIAEPHRPITLGHKPPYLLEPCQPDQMYKCGTRTTMPIVQHVIQYTPPVYTYVPPTPDEIREARIEGVQMLYSRYGRYLTRDEAISFIEDRDG